MDLTNIDRMRAWVDEGQIPMYRRLLDNMITALSARVETFLGRYVEQSARTAYSAVEKGQSIIWVKGYPVTAWTAIYEDATREWAAASTVDSGNYDSSQDAFDKGRLAFNYTLQESESTGMSVVKISYTGGMAASTATFITAYPGLVMAMEKQLQFAFNHKDLIGLDGVGGGDMARGVRRQMMLLTWWKDWGDLLPDLVTEIKMLRSPSMLRRV